MPLERSRRLRRLVYLGIGVVCLCVVMFMLGSTMTLWTMQFALEQTDNDVLEGFSVPTTISNVIPPMPVTPARQTTREGRRDIDEHDLLRPPNTTV
jgi:hypothetical protein